MVDFEKKSGDDETSDFGQPFDYDPTAEASLSEQPATSDSVPPHGSTTSTGPGWDTYSGVGNGPGWGGMPSYPAPLDSIPTARNPTESYPLPGFPTDTQQTQGYPTAFGSEDRYASGAGGPQAQYPGAQYPQAQYPGATQYPQAQYPGATQYPQAQYPQAQYPGAQYPQAPYSGGPYLGQPHYPHAGSGYGATPTYFSNAGADAPFGRDPITGEPLSDKSKIVAGLLQIFLGGFGAGRFYIGSNGIAVAQLLLLVVGWLTVVVGIGVLILMGLGIWVLVDGILMLVGNVKDSSGRRLRN